MKKSCITRLLPGLYGAGFPFLLACCWAFLVFGWTACSNDPEVDPGRGPEPDPGGSGGTEEPACHYTPYASIRLWEDSRREAGVPTVTTTRTYGFDRGRLVSASTVQRFTAVEPQTIERHTAVGYAGGRAVVENENDTVAVYRLNAEGYAECCEYREGDMILCFVFEYLVADDGRHYLTRLAETLRGTETAEIRIEYEDTRIVRIRRRLPENGLEQEYTAPVTPEIVNTGGIPCIFLAEMYPISFHSEALYGRILGEPAGYLVSRFVPGSGDETITYTYRTDAEGLVSSLRECIRSCETDYVRTVNYAIE